MEDHRMHARATFALLVAALALRLRLSRRRT